MRVIVYALRQGKDTKLGELLLKGDAVVASADDPSLRNILATPCRGRNGERLTAKDSPRDFLANLHRMYRGVALRVSPVVDDTAPPRTGTGVDWLRGRKQMEQKQPRPPTTTGRRSPRSNCRSARPTPTRTRT